MKTIIHFLTFVPLLWISQAKAYTINLLEPIPRLDGGMKRTVTGDDGVAIFIDYVSALYDYAAMVAGLFCVAVIVFQAVNVIMGGVNNSFVSEAKDKIMQAIFSLVLLLGVAMLLRLVNPGFYAPGGPGDGVVYMIETMTAILLT